MSGIAHPTSSQRAPWNGPSAPRFPSLGGSSQRTPSADIWPPGGLVPQSQDLSISNGLSLGCSSAPFSASGNPSVVQDFRNPESASQPARGDWIATTHSEEVTTTSSRRPPRKPRARPPGDLQWQQNKVHIERLYMKEGLPLPTVVEEMKSKYDFSASERMYKNRFKIWRWSKNLPHEVARWMTEKIQQRRPTETVFYWNDQKWTSEKILHKYGKALHHQAMAGVCAPTPNDIQYRTPPSFAASPQQPRTVAPRSQNPGGEKEGQPGFYLDTIPVNLDLSQTTIADLRRLLDQACRAASAGAIDDANADFRDAVSGSRFMLSPTHEETLRAGYLYASFYANCAHMDKADAVLNWMSEKHIERWGPGHEMTHLHYARTIQLFRSWGRQEHAELLVYKLLDDIRDDGGEDLLSSTAFQPRSSLADIHPEQSFPETNDPDSMSHQLDKIDLAIISGITGLKDVLEVIARHCEDKPDDPHVSLQACRAKCSLAKLHMDAGNVDETHRVLKGARRSLTPLLLVGEEPMPRTTLEMARRLSRLFFEIRDETSCNAVLDQVIASVEGRRHILGCDRELDDIALFDFVVSVAFQFHDHGSWDQCRYWAERGLGLAIKLHGNKSSEARRFQKILDKEDFGMRTSTSVHDLMSFSGGLFSIRVVSN